jgi:hypothetical protein
MASLDNSADYKKIQEKINSFKSYNDLMNQYKNARKKAGESFEEKKSEKQEKLSNAKKKAKKFEKQVKNQYEEILDLLKTTSSDAKSKINNFGSNSNSISYIKKLMIKALRNIEPKILEILKDETLTAIGCDQQQAYTQQTIYIKVKSIDLMNLLKIDPNSKSGKILYEKNPIQVQQYPFSMNRELYNRIVTPGSSYLGQYGQRYRGGSGQDLFDIQFVQYDNNGETGPWYKIDLINRVGSSNKVAEFVIDYYKTIKLFEQQNVIANIMELITGMLSINGNIGISFVKDATTFQRILMRILGLCFDNKTEIDISGIAKVSETDAIDDSFFEMTEIDLRIIDGRIDNIIKGVVEFENCDNLLLPVNSDAMIEAIFNIVKSDSQSQEDSATENATNGSANGPEWNGVAIQADLDFNFVKLIIQGLVVTLLSPKILLPIFTMLKALGQNSINEIDSYIKFAKSFRKYLLRLTSKIGALFVKELFELLKKDIKNLIQQIILDVVKEKNDKRILMILKLVQIITVVAKLINDYRQCKTIIDEILQLLKIATTGWGGEIPLPLLFGSQLLDGYSESRAFLGTIEELQKIGIPTGPMPDGSPNLDVLAKFAQMKGMANEQAENGKTQIALRPIAVLPIGVTEPATGFGKSF